VLERETQKRIQVRSADAASAPGLPDIKPPYASHSGIPQKRILIESTNRDEEITIEVATEHLAGAIEPIISADPLVDECVQEPIAVIARLCPHLVQSWRRELNSLYQNF
jgi:hypothetical protein